MKVLVCGGRHFASRTRLNHTLTVLHETFGPITELIHGAASGADSMGADWAKERGVEPKPYPADWDNIDVPGANIKYHPSGKPYNAAAGRMRNQKMMDEGQPDLVVAFTGGTGTDNMVSITERAIKNGNKVRLIDKRRI